MAANNGGTAVEIKKFEEKLPAFPDAFQWDPFHELMRLRPSLRSLYDWPSFFATTPAVRGYGFDIDLREKDGKYIAECSLPGFKKGEIDIQVRGNNLTITAKSQGETKEQAANYVYRERHRGEYCRTMAFPEPIDPKRVEAFYKDGILEVFVPMTQQPKTEKVEIKG